MSSAPSAAAVRGWVRQAGGSVRPLLPRSTDYAGLRRSWPRDLAAGITVGVVALPLALAFSVATGVGAAPGLITAVIAAPIVEEMVFRGVVMRGLRSRLPVVVVIVLQGALFGVAHVDPVRGVGNIGLVMVLSGVGVAFGVAAALLGRIGPTIVAHAIFNGMVLLLVLSGVADRLQNEMTSTVSASIGEQIGVVDQADVAESGCHRDADPAWLTVLDLEPIDRAKCGAVEHGHVLERGEPLGGDDLRGGCHHAFGVRVA